MSSKLKFYLHQKVKNKKQISNEIFLIFLQSKNSRLEIGILLLQTLQGTSKTL